MKREDNWFRWTWEPMAVLSVIVLVPTLFLSAAREYDSVAHKTAPAALERSFSEQPHVVRPLVAPLFVPGSEEHAAIQAILSKPPQPALDGPVAIHLLRLYRQSAIPRSDVTSGADVLGLLTGHGTATYKLPETPLVQTRAGARYHFTHRSKFGENHRDVFLATFAEAGLALSTSLRSGGDTSLLHISDLLRDSISNFHLGQKELEWTSIAYALYMPDSKGWHNRDGERFTHDRLAGELLTRSISEGLRKQTNGLR